MNLSTQACPDTAVSSNSAQLVEVDSVGERLKALLLQPAMRIAHAKFISELGSAPQPADAPRGYGRGLDPDRVLLFSSNEFASSGVVSHQLALAGQLAGEVSQATQRGTDVDLSVHSRRTIRSAPDSIRVNELQKYDAVVVALGESDAFALTAPQSWSSGMESLLSQIRSGSVAGTPIFVTGIPGIGILPGRSSRLAKLAQNHAVRLDRATERVCARWCNATFVPVAWPSSSGDRRTASTYAECARHIARQLAPTLSKPGAMRVSRGRTARSVRSRQQPLLARQQALLDLGVTFTDTDEGIDRVVNLARTYFRTQHAALLLLDGDTMRFRSKSGFRGNPDMTKHVGPTISTGRPVFTGSTPSTTFDLPSLHVGGAEMGFYAGYPIETPDGHRVGVLAVFDRKPRSTPASNTVMLRDLAMLLQRELWATGG